MRPSPWLVALLAAWGALGLAVTLGSVPHSAWWAAGAVVLLVAAVDAWRLRVLPTPAVGRVLPEALALGVGRGVMLTLESRRGLRVDVHDLYPGAWPTEGLPRTLRLRPGHAVGFEYRLRPTARGRFAWPGTELRLHSPFALWRQRRLAGTPGHVRVYPDFAPLARLALFSAEQASRLVGAHVKRRRGEGTDFNQMREYRVGDSLRQIDWKATARARKLISREYQDERNQQMVLLLDTGRRMMAQEGALSHFDHVLNGAMVVSYLALRQGDAVGLLASGVVTAAADEAMLDDLPGAGPAGAFVANGSTAPTDGQADTRWVAPRRGMATIDTLLRACHDLQPRAVATDYLAAATELSARQQRRALVMLVTNVGDEDLDDLLAAVHLLRRRHLVCIASLRERALDDVLEAEVVDLPGAIQAGAVASYLASRSAAHERLRSHGVMVLDVSSEALPAALVERYLAVKRDGLL